MDSSCPFCRIVAGHQEADVVHSSDQVLAFRDINPQAPTHILLIPKDHVASVRNIGDSHAEFIAEVFGVATHLAKAEGIDRTGWRLVTNVGAGAGQSVNHLHFHLLGGRQMKWPPG
jgi:histidine triad (HIT) family protein